MCSAGETGARLPRRQSELNLSFALRAREYDAQRVRAKAKRAGEDASALLEANKARAEEIKRLDASLEAIEAERQQLLLRLPNGKSPFEDVKFAEEINIVHELDLAVSNGAIKRIMDANEKKHHLSLAVNMSAKSLLNDSFIAMFPEASPTPRCRPSSSTPTTTPTGGWCRPCGS